MDRTNGDASGACAAPPPVPVGSPAVPVDLMVVKKRLGSGEMAVRDAAGRLAYRVAAADGGGRALLDEAGCALVTVRSSEDEWQAFKGTSLEHKDIIFTAKAIPAASNRKEVHVFIPPRDTFEDPKQTYKLIGNPSRKACTIIEGNSIVAQTSLLYKLRKAAVYSRRKFRVTIYPSNDSNFIMAMIMTFLIEK